MKKFLLLLILLTLTASAADVTPPSLNSTQLANTFVGAPDGSNGLPTFRGLTTGDLGSVGLNASNLTSGTVPVTRLGSGSSSLKFLRGDSTWQLMPFVLDGSNNVQYYNTLMGSITSAANNVALGTNAFHNVTSGSSNVGLGLSPGAATTTGSNNIALGVSALTANTTGSNNTAIGYHALLASTTGGLNISIGDESMKLSTTSGGNIAIGQQALQATTVGFGSGTDYNIAIGHQAFNALTTGIENVAIGDSAGDTLTTGSYNLAIGQNAGATFGTGNFNTAIGKGADVTTGSFTKCTAIGYNATCGASSVMALGGTGGDAVSVGIGNTTPSEVLEVTGNVKATQFKGLIQDIPINAQTASYTLVLGDNQKLVTMTVGSANTLTIPPNSSVAFPVGAQILVAQMGSGKTTITQGSGVTIVSLGATSTAPVTSNPGGMVALIKTATNTWLVTGDTN